MVPPGCGPRCRPLLRRPEPLVVLQQLGSSLFDTALLLLVKERCAAVTDDRQQRAMSDFYMTYNLILQVTPIAPALLLARAGDRGWRRAPVLAPLGGFLLAGLLLLILDLWSLPLQLMFGAAALTGLSGGFCAYWPGVMTLVSLGSTTSERSKVSGTSRLSDFVTII